MFGEKESVIVLFSHSY